MGLLDADIQPVELDHISVARKPEELLGKSDTDFGEQLTGSAACAALQDRTKAGLSSWGIPCSCFDGGYSNNGLLQAACFLSASAQGT